MDREKAHRFEAELADREPRKDLVAEPAAADATQGNTARLWRSLGAAQPNNPDEAATLAVDHKGSGTAVDPQLAGRVGAQTGTDVSQARVHGDPVSRAATAAMGSRAFAHGSDVFLGPGESGTDVELMAHELAHVSQQQGGAAVPQRKVTVGAASSPAETDADRVASNVTANAPPVQLLVDVGPLAPGQMLATQFKPLLRASIVAVVEQELGKLGATAGCPYIDRYFTKYGQSAAGGEALIRHWIPTAKQAQKAADLIPLVLVRVREGVRSWHSSGRLPPDLVAADPEIAAAPVSPAPGAAHAKSLDRLEADLGPGEPLSGETASRMTRGPGAEVSGARVHTGPIAEAKAAEHGAAAFAVGPNVVMGKGAPGAGTIAGDALLAHELAHTAQQQDAARDPEARRKPIGGEEQAAEANADRAVAKGDATFGSILKTGLQLQRCPEPAAELDRSEYYEKYQEDIALSAASHLRKMPFATYDPAVHWTQDGERNFAGAFADQVITRPRGDTIESLVRPDLIGKLVDQSRVVTKEPNTGATTGRGPDAHFPAIGVEVGNSLVRRATESLQREVPRYAQARLAAGHEPNPADLAVSHPVDPMIAHALTRGNIVTIEGAAFTRRHPDLGADRSILQTRPLKLEPQGTTGMWHRLIEPLDATVEEVANQLTGSSTEAFRIENAHPLYGINPDTRHSHGYVDPENTAGNQLLIAGGALADEAALAQAGPPPKGARPAARILEQMRLNATMMQGSVREAAQRFGLGKQLDAEAARIAARAEKLMGQSDGEVAKWDTQTARQADIISRGARGLDIDHLRLETYATQFGADLKKDAGAFGLPDEYRQALRADAELWTAALASSELVGTAEQRLLAASQNSMTLEIEILERGLAVPQEAAFASQDSDNVKADFDADKVGDREMDLRTRLGTMRAQMLADPTKIDPKAGTVANEETRDLIFESQVVLQAASLDQAWRALDDADGWMSTVTFDSDELGAMKTEGKKYYTQWKGVYDLIKKGEKVAARTQFETICADKAFQSFLHRVNELLKSVQKHHLIATLIAMVVITIVSMGAGSVLASALGGTAVTVGVGAEATTVIVGGIGVARNTAAVAGFIAEVATFTFLANRAFSKDHSIGALAAEFGKNIILFGAMRGVAAGFRAAGLTKVIEAGFKADATAGAMAKAGIAQVSELVLNGSIGMLLAIVDAKVREAMGGKPMTPEELDHLIKMTVAQTVVMTIAGRLLVSPMTTLKVKAAFLGKKWKTAYDTWKIQSKAVDVLSKKEGAVEPEEVVAAAARDREQIEREIDALEELKARADKDPKALEGSGVDVVKDIDPQLANLKGQAEKMHGLEMTMSLKELSPNHFEAPRAKAAEILKTHAELGNTAELEATDPQTGARTWKLTPKDGSQPIRVTESMPEWALTTAGRRLIYAARKAGIDDSAIFNLTERTRDSLMRAAEAKSEVAARKALHDTDLDAKTRDKIGGELEKVRAAANARPEPRGCFVAGTPVWARDGLRAIETLVVGDDVISTDIATHRRRSSRVVAVEIRTSHTVIDLEFAGESISCSDEHPFWIPGIGWREAGALVAGVVVGSAEGDTIVDVVRRREESVTVYNLRVDGSHTYHVSARGLLVHNKGNAHEFFANRKQLVEQLTADLANLERIAADTTTTGEPGKADLSKRTDLADRIQKAKKSLEGTKDVSKDLTIDDGELMEMATKERATASDEVASLKHDVGEAKKPFAERLKELTDGHTKAKFRHNEAVTKNDKLLDDAAQAKKDAGGDKAKVEAAENLSKEASGRRKQLTSVSERLASVERDAKSIVEDPASDSGVSAQKAKLAAAEAELARVEADLAAGHMFGSKGPKIPSKTLWLADDGYERIDVENPNPGQRPGQIHYQPMKGVKWYYDPVGDHFYNQKSGEPAPKSVQDRLADPEIRDAVDEGLRQLGEGT